MDLETRTSLAVGLNWLLLSLPWKLLTGAESGRNRGEQYRRRDVVIEKMIRLLEANYVLTARRTTRQTFGPGEEFMRTTPRTEIDVCNEYYWKRVHGEWLWVRGHRPDGYRGPKDAPPQPDLFAIFPDRVAPVIAKDKNNDPGWHEMRWGFPPPNTGARVVTNVRNTASGFWRNWLDPNWRCVVPFDVFVEFSDATPKVKHFFSVTDNEPAAFAGIWRPWMGTRGTKAAPVEGEHHLFAILTTEANDVVRPVHAKAMPVLLSGEDQQRAWLTMSVEEALALQARPFAPERMRVQM